MHVLDWLSLPVNDKVTLSALAGLKERAKTLDDLTDSASYLWRTRPLDIDAKADRILNSTSRAILVDLAPCLANIDGDRWNTGGLETALKAYATGNDLKLGSVAQPLSRRSDRTQRLTRNL